MNRKIKFSFVAIFALVLMIQTLSAQDELMFRKHIIYSGVNGLLYGAAFDLIAGLNGGAAAGIPVVSAGVSALIPLLSNSSKTITPNSIVLSGHGKIIGWAHGFAFATLIGGENAWHRDNYKLTVGLGAVTSIGLGILGNSLGKNYSWTDGQVALYRHYGWIGPFTGISLMAAFSDEPRLYGASVLLFGAGGYFLADKVYNWHEYTRGDVRATQVLSLLNGGLGYGIFAEKESQFNSSRAIILFPVIGVLSGTLAGHLWLKNANLTPKQGRQTAYAASGGALLGLGIALMTESEKATPYYVIPYITGLGAYTFAVESLRKKNKTQGILTENQRNNWEFAFMPQNLFLNAKMSDNSYWVNGNYIGIQPLFGASLTF